MDLGVPHYFVVGKRPVKFVPTKEGGLDVLAWDWEDRVFKRDMSYLSRCMDGGLEIDELEKKAFDDYVDTLLEETLPGR